MNVKNTNPGLKVAHLEKRNKAHINTLHYIRTKNKTK